MISEITNPTHTEVTNVSKKQKQKKIEVRNYQ